jgi:hypothetical protein
MPAPAPEADASAPVPETLTKARANPKRRTKRSKSCPESKADARVLAPLIERSDLPELVENFRLADLDRIQVLTLSGHRGELDPCLFAHFLGLRVLVAPGLGLSNLSGLRPLKYLETLKLAHNPIVDLSPIARLERLERIDLGHTPIDSVESLAGLEALKELFIDHTKVSDLEPLQGLTKLERLDITGANVSKLEAVAQLRNLKFLYADAERFGEGFPVHAQARGAAVLEPRPAPQSADPTAASLPSASATTGATAAE